MQKNYLKKGQFAGSAVGSIITLTVGVGVAVLVLIFVGTLGGQTFSLLEDDISTIGNNAVLGDTFVANATNAVSLDHSFIQTGTLHIYNNSNQVEFGLNNFTIDYDAGTVISKGLIPGLVNGSTLGANYTWGASDIRLSVQDGIVNSFDALDKTGSYIPVIVLAVVIALVLSIVLGFTAFGGRNFGGSAL